MFYSSRGGVVLIVRMAFWAKTARRLLNRQRKLNVCFLVFFYYKHIDIYLNIYKFFSIKFVLLNAASCSHFPGQIDSIGISKLCIFKSGLVRVNMCVSIESAGIC